MDHRDLGGMMLVTGDPRPSAGKSNAAIARARLARTASGSSPRAKPAIKRVIDPGADPAAPAKERVADPTTCERFDLNH